VAKKIKNYSCFLISNKPNLHKDVISGLISERVTFFDGTGVESFSQLVNRCVESCTTEIVILMSDKMRPIDENIQKTVKLIEEGYAFVGMYRFGFFGFKKELFRKIGPMDERYVGGCWEDDDFYIRLREANLSMYLSQEVGYIKSSSSWNHTLSKKHFYNKWFLNETDSKTYRRLDEVKLNYNFGPNISTHFLPWSYTKLLCKKIKKYEGLEIGYE
jgi:GT2 family glycosyltransferase